jgi:hypothetical protein
MAKNHNRKPAKHHDPMGTATTVFLAGCFAELYLLMIRRFYVNGTLDQVLSWYTALPYMVIAGAIVLVAGIVLSAKWKRDPKKKGYAFWTMGIGLFLTLSTTLIRWNMSTMSLLTVVVPVAMLLTLVWLLYDRECALTLTILSTALIMLWICRRLGPNPAFGAALKLLGAGYILLLVAIAVIVKQKKFPLLNPSADPLPVYIGSGLCAVAVLVALFSTTLAYYAIWALAAVVFALAVYYTGKQL